MKRALFFLVVLGATTADAKPFSYESKTRYADVEFSYSAEAAAVPQLVKRFRAELAKEQTAMVDCGKAETEARTSAGSDGIACQSSTAITTSGVTERLLSFAKTYYAFTGGAHGNGATTPLLWDRRRAAQIDFGSLFVLRNGYAAALRAPYCRGLNHERKKRRGDGYEPGAVPEFDACPQFSDLAVIPAASNGRHRFDQVHVIAAPYAAGPYVEGEYDVAIPVTARLIGALKPEYRASFEAQRQ